MLSSSAIMSAALPPLPPASPRPARKQEHKLSEPLAGAGQVQLDEEQKRQAPADKGLADLVGKLGLNKDQSAAFPQPSSAGSVVTPALQQQQRNSLTSVR